MYLFILSHSSLYLYPDIAHFKFYWLCLRKAFELMKKKIGFQNYAKPNSERQCWYIRLVFVLKKKTSLVTLIVILNFQILLRTLFWWGADHFKLAIISNPISSSSIISNPIISNPIISNPIISNPIISNQITYNPITSYPIISNLITSNPILSRSYLTRFYLIISNPIISNSIISTRSLLTRSILTRSI